jgi:hypothetical protein
MTESGGERGKPDPLAQIEERQRSSCCELRVWMCTGEFTRAHNGHDSAHADGIGPELEAGCGLGVGSLVMSDPRSVARVEGVLPASSSCFQNRGVADPFCVIRWLPARYLYTLYLD